MRLRIKLFATYREIVGSKELTWTARDGERVDDILRSLLEKYPRLTPHRDTMLLAVNQAFASPDAVLQDGDEVAVMPPVSGGSR
jgi:molybdopterin converting factor subunit 1